MEVDKQAFLASQGGAAKVAALTPEAKADAMEDFMMRQLVDGRVPRASEIEARIETRPNRRGVGNLFYSEAGNVQRLPPMPDKPTLADFFRLRFMGTSNHVLQSAHLAVKNGVREEIVLACLLHDVSQELIRVDHGYWSAHLFEPYVPEETTFAIRYHQALRFYPDDEHGYKYPNLYRYLFGEDYKPEPYIEADYKMVRNHKWYMGPRLVTVNDLYAFDPNVNPSLDEFSDIIGRHFKQPKEGLGFDNSTVAHIWRSLARPDAAL